MSEATNAGEYEAEGGRVSCSADGGCMARRADGGSREGRFMSEYEARRTIGKPHPDRARQFKPFAALKGYYDLLAECERVPEPRRSLTEEEQRELSDQVTGLVRGQVVTVTYYDKDACATLTGAVGQVDEVFRTLWIVRTPIPFDDIVSIGS